MGRRDIAPVPRHGVRCVCGAYVEYAGVSRSRSQPHRLPAGGREKSLAAGGGCYRYRNGGLWARFGPEDWPDQFSGNQN